MRRPGARPSSRENNCEDEQQAVAEQKAIIAVHSPDANQRGQAEGRQDDARTAG
jgi:hypothetical protein